MKVNNFVEDTQ